MVQGYFHYNGIPVAQKEGVEDAFHMLFKAVKPSRVIEIGTSCGGLTIIMRDLLDRLDFTQCPIWTYDIPAEYYDRQSLDRAISSGSNIMSYLDNIFEDNFSNIMQEKQDDITQFIQSPGTTIILCDGGSKKDEFRIFSDIMKSGDIILAHDYAPNEEIFKSEIYDKVWNWMEIQDSDIKEPVHKNRLMPFLDSIFINYAWVSKIKA